MDYMEFCLQVVKRLYHLREEEEESNGMSNGGGREGGMNEGRVRGREGEKE